MNVFELHLNPKSEKDTLSEAFYYEPEGPYEARMGNLFMVGELRNASLRDSHFFNNLARAARNGFFDVKMSSFDSKINSSEGSFRKCLKETNEFLNDLVKQGEVSWLSNLDFAVLSLLVVPGAGEGKNEDKKFKVSLSATDGVEILLLRKGRITNLSISREEPGKDSPSLKIFTHVVSTKTIAGDKIIILSKRLRHCLKNNGYLDKIAKLPVFEERAVKTALKEIGKEASGACLLIDLSEKIAGEKQERLKELVFRTPLLSRIRKIKLPALSSLFLWRILLRNKTIKIIEKLSFLKINRDFFKFPQIPSFSLSLKSLRLDLNDVLRKSILLSVLLVLIVFGRYFAQKEEAKRRTQSEQILNEVKQKTEEAEVLYSSGQDKEAKKALMEAYEEVNSITFYDDSNLKELELVKKEIKKSLSEVFNLIDIESPDVFFEFSKNDFLPQKILWQGGKLYSFSLYAKGVNIVDENKKSEFFPFELGLDSATSFGNEVAFFSKPETIVLFQGGSWKEPAKLVFPYEGFKFDNFDSFQSESIFLLDEENRQIVRYKYFDNRWRGPELWLKEKLPLSSRETIRSFSVDGSLWILSDDLLTRYYAGQLQDSFPVSLFPILKEPSKIVTPFLSDKVFILDSEGKRVIVLSKKDGEVIKQYRSQSFDNLKDLSVSPNGRKIFVLSGDKVYLINE